MRRAIELAEAALPGKHEINTLGPLVHNARETARLAAAGIRAVETPEEVRGDTVVIRAHGASPDAYTRLRDRGVAIVDATCPVVNNSQRIARAFAQGGYTLVIVGHPEHPEVEGILGYVSTPAYVVSQPEEVAALPPDIRPGVIAQTTVNEETFFNVVTAIAQKYARTRGAQHRLLRHARAPASRPPTGDQRQRRLRGGRAAQFQYRIVWPRSAKRSARKPSSSKPPRKSIPPTSPAYNASASPPAPPRRIG